MMETLFQFELIGCCWEGVSKYCELVTPHNDYGKYLLGGNFAFWARWEVVFPCKILLVTQPANLKKKIRYWDANSTYSKFCSFLHCKDHIHSLLHKYEYTPNFKQNASCLVKGYPSIGMFSSLNVSWLRYSGPPQGGLRNTTSADRVCAIDKKSAWMNSILSATPYTSALFLAHSSLASSISIAITASYNRNQSNTGRNSNDIVMQIHVATVRGFTLCGSQGELL